MMNIMRQSLLLSFLLLLPQHHIHAAHSRRRPVVRREVMSAKYDRAITTFSADGRLQQVEYGMEAANRGETAISAKINDTTAIIAMSSDNNIHRLDEHVVVVTSGLAGDGRALAGALRTTCQRHYMSYGEAPTVKEIATVAAQLQHDLTKTEGARPLGCTAMVVGVDKGGDVQLYHTDPGGVLEHCSYCVAGKNKGHILEKLAATLGGDEQSDAQTIMSKVLALLKEGKERASASRSIASDKSGLDLWIIRATDEGSARLTCMKNADDELLEARLF